MKHNCLSSITHIIHVDILPVKYFGQTNVSSLRVDHKYVEGILVCTFALQRVDDIPITPIVIRKDLKQ